MRDAANELDDLYPALDLAARVAEHLAMLAGDEARELVGVLFEELAEPEHHAGTLERRGRRPRRERTQRIRDRALDVGARRVRRACGDGAGRRIVDVPKAAAGADGL